jgi:hypothetical protein
LLTTRRQNPIFVLAPVRSCSTIITAMLGQHPSLYGFPELNPFRWGTIGELLDYSDGTGSGAVGSIGSYLAHGTVRAVAEVLLGGQDEATIDRATSWLEARRAWAPWDLLHLLLARVEPRIGVEKSPGNLFTQTACSRMLEMFPNARFIHLVRHPITSVRSLKHHLCAWGWIDPDRHDPLGEAALMWYVFHRRLSMLGDQIDASRWCRVRAEDILSEPEANLRPLCEWLGIDSSPFAISCMSHPENSPYASVAPKHLTGGDHHFLTSPRPRFEAQDSHPTWPADWALADKLRNAVDELGQSFGYNSIFETTLAH